MYSLLPILVFLATANAAAIDRSGAQAGAVEKRGCLIDPLGILGLCNAPAAASSSSSSAKASSTSSSSSSSSSSKAATSTSVSVSASTSSSSVKPTTTTSVAQSSTSTAGNIIQTVAAVPVSVVSQVLTCPLDPLGVLGLCGNGNATPASSSAAQSTSTSKAAASASSSAPASSSASTGNVVSSIVAVPSNVVSQAASIVNPVVSSAAALPSVAVSQAASIVNPVVSSAVAIPSAVVSSAASIVSPVVSSAVAIPSAVVSSAASIVNPVVSSVSSIVAPSSAASSVSSIIASVSASSAQASSSSSAVVSVAPTTTSTSTTPSATPSPSNAAVSGWKYANCVAEGTSGRALTGSTFAGSSMTVESCLASCDASGYALAGLEYSGECYCGSSLTNGASLSKTGTCAMTCSGNPLEICGGSATLSLYVSTKTSTAGLNSDLTAQTAQPAALPAGWSSTTCMQEVSGRAFTKKSTASDDMTIQKCLAFCGDSKYAGLEYGRECYCADTLSNGASLSSTSGQCVTPCAGAASTTCGGPMALQVYTNSNFKASSSGAYTNTGCVQEVDGRLLRGASIAGDNMTIETCTNFCQSQSMSIAGLEYGRECYCSNSYVSTPLSSGQCNMPCAGNGAQNCGGPNALNIFTLA